MKMNTKMGNPEMAPTHMKLVKYILLPYTYDHSLNSLLKDLFALVLG
jgi:hypothetical protein